MCDLETNSLGSLNHKFTITLDKYSLNSNVRFKFKQSMDRSDYVINS